MSGVACRISLPRTCAWQAPVQCAGKTISFSTCSHVLRVFRMIEQDQVKALNHADRMQAVLFIGDLAYADDYVSALAHGMLQKAFFSCMTAHESDSSACSMVLPSGRVSRSESHC